MMKVAVQIVGETLGGAVTNRDVALAAYRRRTDQVRAVIRPERLLAFDVAEGWDPLCRFLRCTGAGAPVPRRKLDGRLLQVGRGRVELRRAETFGMARCGRPARRVALIAPVAVNIRWLVPAIPDTSRTGGAGAPILAWIIRASWAQGDMTGV
jgi:hypothetical protein